jgi:phosphoribosylanthranilate isomerase
MPPETWVKICGITSPEDALAAVRCGADAVGFVFAPSRRGIGPAEAERIAGALGSKVMKVGVFVDEEPETVRRIAERAGLDAVQLHGSESAESCAAMRLPVIKRFDVRPGDTPETLASRMDGYHVFACLLDPGAGDGIPFDWNLAKGIPFRVIVAGGLNSGNVGEAIRTLRPFGVDVSSGVENGPGKKDFAKMSKFIEEVRNA